MAVESQDRPAAEQADQPGHDVRPEGRRARWWASWRIAVRMARRDVRRHKGRSALIAIMVALPVIALVAGAAIYATSDLDAREQLPLTLGSSTASLFHTPGMTQAVQDATLEAAGTSDQTARPIPGFAPSSEAAALAALTDGEVTEVSNATAIVTVSGRQARPAYLGIDGAHYSAAGDRARLLTGRWPATADEVLVTPLGIRDGLPSTGTIRLLIEGADEKPRDVTIVGTGTGYVRSYNNVDPAKLIGLTVQAGVQQTYGTEYLLARSDPVLGDEVRRLNGYGILVLSRALVLDPSLGANSGLELDPYADGLTSRKDVQFAGAAGLAGVGLLLLTSLLAGPAFAVSAARQRHTLALAASNGADRRQLRRTVLGQALVLGVGATAVALGVGLVAAWLITLWLRASRPDALLGPFDIPWLAVLVIVASAVISSVVSALLPSRGLGRLDIVGVLRGQAVSPRLRRRVPIVGITLAAGGAAVTLAAGIISSPNTMAVGSAILVLGALLVVPLLLMVLGRLTRHAPVAIRMATRDAARQRGRATPTVAAILAGAAVLSTVLVFAASTAALSAKTYVPRMVPGHGSIGTQNDVASVIALAEGAAPGVSATRIERVVVPMDNQNGPMTSEPFLMALRPGCTPQSVLSTLTSGTGTDARCRSVGATLYGGDYRAMLVASPDYLSRLLHLNAAQEQALRSGSIVAADGIGAPGKEISLGDGSSIYTPGGATIEIVDGKLSFARFDISYGNNGPTLAGPAVTTSAPAVSAPRASFTAAFPQHDIGAVMVPVTAKRLGFGIELAKIALDAGDRSITHAEQDAIAAALAKKAPDSEVYIERGFQDDTLLVFLIAVGVIGLIILIATLIATALAQAESQSMSSTLAAVGATRTTRRNLAAAQAGLLALLGTMLGVLIGIVPGVAVSWSNSLSTWDAIQNGITDPTIVIPWLQLAAPVIAVPVIAAALAWVSIRRHPTVTRSLT